MHTLIPFSIKKTWLGTLVLLSLCNAFNVSNCKTTLKSENLENVSIFEGRDLTSCLPKKKSTAYLMANMKSAWKMKKRMAMDPFFFDAVWESNYLASIT